MSRISTLHPLPSDFAHGQAYQAMVMFDAYAKYGYDDRFKKMSDEADKMNVRFVHPQVASAGIARAAGSR